MPPKRVIEGYPSQAFRNRTLLVIPDFHLRVDSTGYLNDLQSVFLNDGLDSLPAIVSRQLFTELAANIEQTSLINGDTIAVPDGGLLSERRYIGSLRDSSDSSFEVLARLKGEVLIKHNIVPDMVLTFRNMVLSIDEREKLKELWLKGNYLVWDYRINQAVVGGRISAVSRSNQDYNILNSHNFKDLMKQAAHQILFATPFAKD